jgi:limonene-1,2-epoxide hydrolase
MGFGGVRSEILTMASVDQTVFMERTDSMTIGRKPLTTHVAAVLEVNAEGKISAWREYYDTREISVKLGTDAGTSGSRGYDT